MPGPSWAEAASEKGASGLRGKAQKARTVGPQLLIQGTDPGSGVHGVRPPLRGACPPERFHTLHRTKEPFLEPPLAGPQRRPPASPDAASRGQQLPSKGPSPAGSPSSRPLLTVRSVREHDSRL